MNIRHRQIRRLGRLGLILLLCWLLGAPALQAQDAARWDVFRSITPGGGPADDTITSLVATGGTLWAGTRKGLSRYDGAEWNTYTAADGLPSDDLRALLVDRQGGLWIGTVKGLLYVGAGRGWAERQLVRAFTDTDIEAIGRSGDEGVWVGTLEGAAYLESPTADAQPVAGLPRATVEAIWEQAAGDVWYGTRGGGLIHRRVDSEVQVYTETHGLPSAWVHGLWGDDQGDLWVGTEKGACRVSLTARDVSCRVLDQLRERAVYRFLPAPDGSVWMATDGTTKRIRDGRVLETIKPTSETALLSDDVRHLAYDGEGQLWLGTTGGLARRHARLWERRMPANPESDADDVKAIGQDAAGTLWIATANGLKWRSAGDRWQSIAALDGEPLRCLWVEADGSLWVCRDRGIAYVRPPNQVEAPADDHGLMGQEVYAIRRGPDQALWLATAQGVRRWDGSTWTWYQQDTPQGGPVNNFVTSIAPDGATGLWFGTNGGLSHFDGRRWVASSQLGCQVGDLVAALAWEPPGRLWVGTPSGLVLCEKGRQQSWDKRTGLIASYVRALALEPISAAPAEAPRMGLWIGTFDGLSRTDGSARSDEQLPVVSFAGASMPHDRVQAIFASLRYGVLIGTPNGLWAYQPSLTAPQTRLQQRSSGKVALDTLLRPDQPLELAHDQEAALFAVGGDLSTSPENLIYRYAIEAGPQRMEGWSLNGALPITDVLKPGTTIAVTAWAYDRDFNQSAAPARLQIVRRPIPLTSQLWFLILIVSVPAGVSMGGYRAARAWRLYGYHDLELTIAPGHTPETLSIQLNGRRRLGFLLLGPVRRPGAAPPAPPDGQPPGLRWSRFRLTITGRYECLVDWKALERRLEGLHADLIDETLFGPLGEQLAASLFTPEVRADLERHLGLGRQGVRLRLRFEGSERLAALPWEFLTMTGDLVLVRDLSPGTRAKPPRTGRPLKLLVAWASPEGMARLDEEDQEQQTVVGREVQAIQAAFEQLIHKKRAEVHVLPHAEVATFREKVQQENYDLIHFIGHGGVEKGAGVLYFQDKTRQPFPIGQTDLVNILRLEQTFTDHTPKLVVLNACRTAESGSSLAGLAATLVAQGGLPAAVGMGYPISGASAAVFSKAFYEALVRHGQVDYAIARGRAALLSAEVGMGQRDAGVPRLYIGTPGGVIFDMR